MHDVTALAAVVLELEGVVAGRRLGMREINGKESGLR